MKNFPPPTSTGWSTKRVRLINNVLDILEAASDYYEKEVGKLDEISKGNHEEVAGVGRRHE